MPVGFTNGETQISDIKKDKRNHYRLTIKKIAMLTNMCGKALRANLKL